MFYLTTSMPDIMFAVSLLSRYMHCSNIIHYKAAKRVLRYVKGTLSYGVKFMKSEKLELLGYLDSDWAGSTEHMKSTSSYFFTLGSSVFCWSLRKQQSIAQSTVEAKYVVTASIIKCDNQFSFAIAKNPVFHGKTKHFKIKYHFVREMEQENLQDQLADILTKPFGKMKFEKLRYNIRVHSMEAMEECCEIDNHALKKKKWRTTHMANTYGRHRMVDNSISKSHSE
ncbi:laccase-2-like [Gossypium australe]|uniref:Laccase-2-like n=1 Tax=Gossypium australe TaxID=47621 RepID=A0A5B6UQP1_9ROSI|nr:laccase-2-like [Gossypium australe]